MTLIHWTTIENQDASDIQNVWKTEFSNVK